jgi:predicted ester cyclase
MSIDANKSLVARYVELYNTGDLAIADEVLAAHFVDYTHPEAQPGPEDVKRMVTQFRLAFPDAYATIEDIICEGDTVAFRFMLSGTQLGQFGSIAPTGKKISWTGMDFVCIADGKIVELWSSQDTLAMLRQLGIKSL